MPQFNTYGVLIYSLLIHQKACGTVKIQLLNKFSFYNPCPPWENIWLILESNCPRNQRFFLGTRPVQFLIAWTSQVNFFVGPPLFSNLSFEVKNSLQHLFYLNKYSWLSIVLSNWFHPKLFSCLHHCIVNFHHHLHKE